MKNIKIYKIKGSYAVEAAFVVPIILGLIFAMIYVMYYFHDKNVVYANMQKAAVNVAEGRKEYKDSKEWQEDMQENLWMFKVTSGKISKDKLYIKSDIKAECSLDIPVINYFLESKQQIVLEDKYLAVHPEYMIRIKESLSKE
ncbi:MAG TPA: hypothetical protein DCZ23_01825 [Lachnospiraceae bacterium]|nr:hypothetical protein [Lachnospiraceae bacterium]